MIEVHTEQIIRIKSRIINWKKKRKTITAFMISARVEKYRMLFDKKIKFT